MRNSFLLQIKFPLLGSLFEGYSNRDIAICAGICIVLIFFGVIAWFARKSELEDDYKERVAQTRLDKIRGRFRKRYSGDAASSSSPKAGRGHSTQELNALLRAGYMGQSLGNQHHLREDLHDIKDTLHNIDKDLGS